MPGIGANLGCRSVPPRDVSTIKQHVVADEEDQDENAAFGPCRHLIKAESVTALYDDGTGRRWCSDCWPLTVWSASHRSKRSALL